MEELIKRIKEEYSFLPAVLEELQTIIEAWEGIGMTEKEIKKELEDYTIYL